MADVHYTLRKGLYDRLVGASNPFRTAVQQMVASVAYYKLYYHQAPQTVQSTQVAVTLPYVVFDILPITPDRDSATKWYTASVQFVVSALTIAECETIVSLIASMLEDSEAVLSFSGFSTISIMRGPEVHVGLIDNVENLAIQYTVTIQG